MTIVFYKNSKKKEPVKEFFNTLENDSKKKVGAKIIVVSEMLKNHQKISKELFKKIDDIWEIRVNNIRIFVLLYDGNMYLLHAIIKKRNDIPKKDLSLANERAKEIKSYIDENKK